jgi:hypothetical protein
MWPDGRWPTVTWHTAGYRNGLRLMHQIVISECVSHDRGCRLRRDGKKGRAGGNDCHAAQNAAHQFSSVHIDHGFIAKLRYAEYTRHSVAARGRPH